MQRLEAVTTLLRRSRLRVGAVSALDAAGAWAPVLVAALLLVGAASAADWVPAAGAWVLVALVTAATVAAVTWQARRAAEPRLVARRLDRHLDNGDALASALDFADRAERSRLADAHIARAEASARDRWRAVVLPWPLPHRTRWAVIAAAAVLAALGPHYLGGRGAGAAIAPERARAVAEGTRLVEKVLPELELTATDAGLHVLAKRLRNVRSLVKKELKRLEDPVEDPPESLPSDTTAESRPTTSDIATADAFADLSSLASAPASADKTDAVGLPEDYAPIGKFDAGPIDAIDRAAFAELDSLLAKRGMTPGEIADLADDVEETSRSIHNFGADSASHADSGSGKPDGSGGAGSDLDGRPPKDFDGAISGLMAKSFGEFLRKYTHKLRAEARSSALDRAKASARSASTISTDLELPAGKTKLGKPSSRSPKPTDDRPSPDAPPMDEAMAKSLLEDGKATERRSGPTLLGDETAVGGSGAGSGASDEEEKVDPTALAGAERAGLDALAGKEGAGDSDVSYFRDGSAYRAPSGRTTVDVDPWTGALRLASEALEKGAVPPDMQDYVRRYFEAIRPRSASGRKPSAE